MVNRLLLLLLIGLMIYAYVTCYSQSATESFVSQAEKRAQRNAESTARYKADKAERARKNKELDEKINKIKSEALGSWHRSCVLDNSVTWEPEQNKLTAKCYAKGLFKKAKKSSVVCPNRKFKNKKGKLKCE